MKYLIVVVGLSSSAMLCMEEVVKNPEYMFADAVKVKNPDHMFAGAVKINALDVKGYSPEPLPEVVKSDEKKSSDPSPTHAVQDDSAQKVEPLSQIAHGDESKSPVPSPTHVVQGDSAQRVMSPDTKAAQKKPHWYQGLSRCFRKR